MQTRTESATFAWRRPSVVITSFTIALIALAGPVEAQHRRRGDTFEELSPGERGQTLLLEGRTNGEVDAAREAATATGPCVGWIPMRPSHLIVLTDAFRRLEISATSTADTTLVIHGPGGTRCNDDTEGVNPSIEGEWLAGTYAVYVGTYDQRITADYTLTLRQGGRRGRGDRDEPAPTTLDVASITPTHASLMVPGRLGRDALILNGRSGGPVDVAYLGNSPTGACVGFAQAAPQHILTLSREMRGLTLRAEGGGDTALVVHGPNGWLCNDDAVGVNPSITGTLPAGQYRVWVGSYLANTSFDYRLLLYVDPAATGSTGPAPPPPPPSGWTFRGAFEGADVLFTGASIDDVNAACRAHLSSTGARMVDDVRVFNDAYHNSSSYWGEQELCAMVALNARPNDGYCELTFEGLVESMPFSLHGNRESVRRLLTTYIPRMASAGWIDDLTVNGRSYRNASSYWSPAVTASILAYNVAPASAAVTARGTIENVPFVFAGDTGSAVSAECNALFASGIETSFIDDVVVNGNSRHNASSYWDATSVCMLVSSLAE